MKPIQLAAMAIVAVLALGVTKAGAVPTTYVFETLNFSLTAAQQDLDNVQTSPNVTQSTLTTFRISSKDLLDLLATALGTNWLTGARLALDNISQDIFVVDKTGTNALYDVSTGINNGDTNVVYFTLSVDNPVFKGKQVSTTSGNHLTQTDLGKAIFHLHVELNGITTTDLVLDGVDTAQTTVNVNTTTAVITLHDNETLGGDGAYGDGTWTVVQGNVTGSGKWKGVPAT